MSGSDDSATLSRKRRSSPDLALAHEVAEATKRAKAKEAADGEVAAAKETDEADQPNWRDVLLHVSGSGIPLSQSESELLNRAIDASSASLTNLRTGGPLNYELDRSLSRGLENWDAMTEQLNIFIQPLVAFCRLVFESPLCREQRNWKREHAMALAKLRIHALFVPVFSLVYEAGNLAFVIDGKPYNVSTKRPLLTEEATPVPGLSAVQASHRYYEYVRRVTGGRKQLLIVLAMLKLFDVSTIEKSLGPPDLLDVAFELFSKTAALTQRAFVTNFGESWREKLRELSILYEWSKTFELSVASLFNTFADQKPEPLFAQLYSD